VNRGIAGQTTDQMLVRFRQDVVALHPAAVVILAGLNDIAGLHGSHTEEMILDNLTWMTRKPMGSASSWLRYRHRGGSGKITSRNSTASSASTALARAPSISTITWRWPRAAT
jgi:hypothetical protein